MKAGLVIVLFALMGSILAGSIGFTQSPVTETEYQRVSDLNPIVSSEAVTGDEIYNPPSNQTGWENVTYQTQSTPSIYSIPNEGTYSSWTSSKTLLGYGGVYYTQTAGNAWNGGSSISWSDGSNGIYANAHMIGGWSGQTSQVVSTSGTFRATWSVAFGSDSGSDGVFWQDLTFVAKQEHWSNIIITTSEWVRPGSIELTSNGEVNEKVTSLTVTPTAYNTGEQYFWDAAKGGWYKLTGTGINNTPVYANEKTPLIWWANSQTSANEARLTGQVYTPGSVTYIKPYSEVEISDGTTATWSNGYSNTKIQLLVKSGATIISGSFNYTFTNPAFDYLLVTLGSECYYQGIDRYISPTDFNVLDYKYNLEVLTATLEPGIDIEYNLTAPRNTYIQIRLDHFVGNPPLYDQLVLTGEFERGFIDNKTYLTVPGYSGETSTAHWYNTHTDLGYEKDVTITLTQSDTVSGLTLAPYPIGLSSISSLSVSGSSMAYIVNTWVPSDPQGLLWSNPTMNINTYFPDIVTAGARVYISSVLTTGTSLTINGSEFETSDKKILIQNNLYPINGIGIDYRTDGHTYVVINNGKTFDLGETSTYVISGAGIWYWSSELDSIVTTTGTQTDILFAQAPDKDWIVFAFCGLTIIGLIGMVAIGRGVLDGWDWIITIMAIVMALMLVI